MDVRIGVTMVKHSLYINEQKKAEEDVRVCEGWVETG